MADLNLIKLCVGADSVDDLRRWIAQRTENGATEHVHVTRMTPKRRNELIPGGSLYWVIKGAVQCRQTLIDVRSFVDDEGTTRCRLVLRPELIPVVPRGHRPFQGWRYLQSADAPADLEGSGDHVEMPAEMRRELAELGLL